MYEISTEVTFEAAHLIPGHPKCGRLHGHTYKVVATLRGETLNDMQFLVDFGKVKDVMRGWDLDHHFLAPMKHAGFSIDREKNELWIQVYAKRYRLPLEDCVQLQIPSSTAECLAELLYYTLSVPFHELLYSVTVYEGANNHATFIPEGR